MKKLSVSISDFCTHFLFHLSLKRSFFFLLLFGLSACQSDPEQAVDDSPATAKSGSHFELLSAKESGLTFKNQITETKEFHHLLWESVFYGGGVSVGDINNDGLPDLYFTGNQVSDALYLNKGNLVFEDISESSGIAAIDGWSTGVTMADVNADGLMDIYVCKSWWDVDANGKDKRRNKLLINNGDLTFTDKAKEFGLDDSGHSTQATFFDSDRDGDLDMYLMNMPSNNFKQKLIYQQTNKVPYEFSDKLFENPGKGRFIDKTKKAGVENYAFGLGLIASDINQDGWNDLYVACDYEKPDLLFINNKNGTFSNRTANSFKHTSFSSMGCDAADFNNDGLLDISVLDMQAADHVRSKTNMRAMNAKSFWQNVKNGNGYQYMSNALQLNTGYGFYSEIGQLAGIGSTDWSWSILMADLDNDTHKDMFVTNGVNRDMRNNDLIEKMKNANEKDKANADLLALAKQFPSERISNYLFKNKGDLTFENVIEDWGLESPGFSYGAAYSDLDQDGDLDLIVCNSNDRVHLFKNKNTEGHHFLQVELKGNKMNPHALGSKVYVYHDGQKQYQELTLTRGFQSSVEPLLHFGLGKTTQVDSVVIIFPNQKTKKIESVKVDQKIKVEQSEANTPVQNFTNNRGPFFKEISAKANIQFRHKENRFDDFAREILLPHMQTKNGPFIAVGDVNGDRREDFYVGGAGEQAGALMIQKSDGTFQTASEKMWEADAPFEDMGAVFADLDGDQDLDLYVVSGGGTYREESEGYQDRIYINDGKGNFSKSDQWRSPATANGSCVVAADIDSDGDIDLFVGNRGIPGKYPQAGRSYLLINHDGRLLDYTDKLAYGLKNIGMVTDATWSDIDGDGDQDLVVVGEWMTPTIFKNGGQGNLTKATEKFISEDLTGWWFHIQASDIDGDGDQDFIVGNMGLNNKYHPNADKPLFIYSTDFDKNNTNDIVLAKKTEYGEVPVRGRECTSQQMPFVATKFQDYKSFANATVDDIYGDDLATATHLTAKEFRSGILINDGKGQLTFQPFPNIAQIAPVQGSVVYDINKDGFLDIALAGNHFDAEVETVRHDASNGLVMFGSKEGNFEPIPLWESQFYVPFNTKDLAVIKNYKNKKPLILTANNNYPIQAYEIQ